MTKVTVKDDKGNTRTLEFITRDSAEQYISVLPEGWTFVEAKGPGFWVSAKG